MSPNVGRPHKTLTPDDLRVHGALLRLSWENLTEPATAAHVHVGPAGVPGGVVIPLSVVNATSGSTTACIENVNAGLLKAIIQNPSGYYVNVHNALRPAGAIRGQLTEPEDD